MVEEAWDDAQAYLEWLSRKTGQHYRLPTEAEWEYACRAGTTSPFNFGDTIKPPHANFQGQTIRVGSLPANPWGLYEMHGNVWEWCLDGLRSYTAEAVTDPRGATDPGVERVMRGGCWYNEPRHCRSACRSVSAPDIRADFIGFRCARVWDQP